MGDQDPTEHRSHRRVLGTYDDVRNALQTMMPRIGLVTPSDLKGALRKLRIKLNAEDFERLSSEVLCDDLEPAKSVGQKKYLPSIRNGMIQQTNINMIASKRSCSYYICFLYSFSIPILHPKHK